MIANEHDLSTSARECLQQLRAWVDAGWLRHLDHVFAAFLAREVPDADARLLLAAALASHQLGRGHACLDLAAALKDPAQVLALPPERGDEAGADPHSAGLPTPADLLAGLHPDSWIAALRDERLVGGGPGDTPLVLVGSRLYLRRYWHYEQSVRAAIEQRVHPEPLDELKTARLREALDALFLRAGRADGSPDWQKIACALAVRSHFGIVTGGPGTGKTTTVVKLLGVLQHLARDAQGRLRPLRIRLAAPTGKAAARLNESIANAVQGLPLRGLADAQALRDAIPTEVTTVHRLLGPIPGTRRFRHDARHPLPLDVLVIDEASMVGLEAMASVVAALAPGTRLVLLGDKDQLASVEAGGLLGQLCRGADAGRYTQDTCEWVREVTGETVPSLHADAAGTPLDQCVVKLRKSHRFGADSGIGQLAQAVNDGDLKRVREIRIKGRADLAWLDLASAGESGLRRLVLHGGPESFGNRGQGRLEDSGVVAPPVGLKHYLGVMQRGPQDSSPQAIDTWARAVLDASLSFQLLCAVRGGRHGVERLNERIATLLHAEKLIASAQGWYAGRPVMVTRNDYMLGLMNGDVGIALEVPGDNGATSLRVAFPAGQGGVRWVLPSRLESVETAFAMTVHKSQGSEFVHAALVLPDRPSPVLTRELVYTAVTRAKAWFTIAGPLQEGLLEQAVQRQTLRAGGLL